MVERTAAGPLGGTWFQGIPLAMETSYRKWTRVARQEKVSPVTLTPLTRAKLTQNTVGAEYSRNWIQGHSCIALKGPNSLSLLFPT